MRITRFIDPSGKQIETAEGSTSSAKQRMLDWSSVAQQGNRTRIAIGDFAAVPEKPWMHADTSEARSLSENTALNGGEVGATISTQAVLSSEAWNLRGIELVQYMSKALLRACVSSSPHNLPQSEDDAREVLRANRQLSPTGYFAVIDIQQEGHDAIIEITQIGDVYVALDTAGRIPTIMDGPLEARTYNGEMIVGAEKNIDFFKAELKKKACELYPTETTSISDQFFYDLIFNGTYREAYVPKHMADLESFKQKVISELRTYACEKYPKLTPETFNEMIKKGMTPWQQNVAQNNANAGPFWYPALDPIGDTPEQGIYHVRFKLSDIVRQPHPRLTIWTDGSKPNSNANISLTCLNPFDNKWGERTEVEGIIDGSSYKISDL